MFACQQDQERQNIVLLLRRQNPTSARPLTSQTLGNSAFALSLISLICKIQDWPKRYSRLPENFIF